MERHIYGVAPGVELNGIQVGGLLPDEVRDIVEELAIKHQKMPVEPTLDRDTGRVIPEQNGQIVDVEKSILKVMSACEKEQIDLITISIHPRYSSTALENINSVIGYCETGIAGSYQRHTNIRMASQGINNILVWPGEVFSFNETVGPRTPERGYLPAPVFLGGGTGTGYGGGVCQVSSTLYNAALDANLDIVERHPHSKVVHYVPPGRDAAVNYGTLDLIFANNRNYPLIIRSGVSQGRIWVKILGEG